MLGGAAGWRNASRRRSRTWRASTKCSRGEASEARTRRAASASGMKAARTGAGPCMAWKAQKGPFSSRYPPAMVAFSKA